MANQISILNVKKDGSDGLIVTFSDGTEAAYVVEELLELRPTREHAAELKTLRPKPGLEVMPKPKIRT
jgi:hypothetical protein